MNKKAATALRARRRRYLITRAVAGLSRPRAKTRIYYTFYELLRKDPEFREIIIKYAPSWSVSCRSKTSRKPIRNTGEKHRNTLLTMAEIGVPRPKMESAEGQALRHLMNRDIEFANNLRTARPDWFIKDGRSRK